MTAPLGGHPRLRVAYLFNHDYFLGGGERSTAELIRRLDRDLFEPLALVPAHGELFDYFTAQGVPVEVCPLPPLREVKRAAPLRAAWNLARVLRSRGVGVLHTGSTRAALYGGLAARLAGVPSVWHVRESLRDRDWYDRLLASLATRLVCVSEGVRDKRFGRFGGALLEKCVVIRNAVDTARIAPDAPAGEAFRKALGMRDDEALFGLVGNVIERKGHDVCVKAVARALRRDAALPLRVLFIGREDLEPEFAARVRSLAEAEGVGARILFAPFTEDVRGMYSALDALLLPTRSEGFSRALVEGMSAGLPVIASDLPENREAVPTDEHALLSPYGDVETLSENIAALAAAPALRLRMGAANRQRAVETFDLAAQSRQVTDLYCTLAPHRGDAMRRLLKTGFLAVRRASLRMVPRPEREFPHAPRRVLVIAPPRLGDTVLALRVPRALKAAHPQCEVHVLAGRVPALVCGMSPHVDGVTQCSMHPVALYKAARRFRGRVDAVLDLNCEWRLRTSLAARTVGAPCAGYDVEGRARLYDRALDGPGEDVPMGRAYDDLVALLGGVAEADGPLLSVPDAARSVVEELWEREGLGRKKSVAVVHPGATHPTQRWGVERFAALADGLGAAEVRVVLIDGPGDGTLLDDVRNAMTGPEAVVARRLPPAELTALLDRADVFAGNNTGTLHLAAALGTPTVSVTGPTNHVRWSPAGPTDTVLRAENLSCLGCKLAHCPWGEPQCMRHVTPDAVCDAVLARIEAARGGRDDS